MLENSIIIKNRIWSEEILENLLKTNDKAVIRALIRVQRFQKENEKGKTKRGFLLT